MYGALYPLLALTLCTTVVGWWEIWPTLFYGGLGLSVLVLTCIDGVFTYGSGSNFHKAIKAMPKTPCCAHKQLSDPNHVKWTTCALRILAGLSATASLFISWSRRSAFVEKRVWFVSAAWCVTAAVWLVSCLPVLVCLIQCAANDAKNGPQMDVLRFRRVSTLWLVHDIVLGSFWVYLSFMLYDLTDDQDDSEWRTIFLSMLSWHIIIVVVYQCYFQTSLARLPRGRSEACCTPEAAYRIWSWVRILSFMGIYTVVILRLQHGNLVAMGFHEPLHVVVGVGLILVACGSKMVKHRPSHNNTVKAAMHGVNSNTDPLLLF